MQPTRKSQETAENYMKIYIYISVYVYSYIFVSETSVCMYGWTGQTAATQVAQQSRIRNML